MKKWWLIFLFFGIFLLTGCNNNEEKILNVLNWSSYIPDSVISDFEKEYGIKVNYMTYSSNEELLAKVNSSKKGTYDLIFPSDYMISLMIEKELIQKIDKSKIINLKNIDPVFLNKEYDSNNDYSLPFLSTIVVIAVNRDNVSDQISGYNDLLDDKYKRNIVLVDDQRIVIGMSLLANHYDMNTIDDYELEDAKKWLLKIKNNIKAYDSDSPKSFFIADEVDIGIMWSAEAVLAKQWNPNVEIIYPKEGYAISTDNYAIVSGAKNIDNAYLFIDYILRPEVQKIITEEYPYISSCSGINTDIIDKEKIFSNSFYVKNIGDKIRTYDKVWADIK